MTRLGYQIPNFTYPDTSPQEIFDKVVVQAQAACQGQPRPCDLRKWLEKQRVRA